MRRRQRKAAVAVKAVDNRNPKRAAFFGVGRSADLVEDHQAVWRCLLQQLGHMAHMRAKAGQAGFNRLAISNIGENLVEDRQRRFRRRHWQRALRHQRQQTHRLHGYRLATCIRTTNQQRSLCFVKIEIERYRTHPLAPQDIGEQRMSRLLEMQGTLNIRRKLRDRTTKFGAKSRLAENKFQRSQYIYGLRNLQMLLPHFRGQLAQDTVTLAQLFFNQPHEFVVELNRLQRFNEDRLPRPARPMHHSLHTTLEVRRHRDHKAVAAHGDVVVLHHTVVAMCAHKAFE